MSLRRRPVAISRSSTSTSSLPPPLDSPNTYINKVRDSQAQLSQVPEIDSEPHVFSDKALVRLAQLQELYKNAQGDPSDGRWDRLPHTLQLICTRRRQENRYCVTKPSKSKTPKDPPPSYILAETEEEWLEWEKKRTDELRLRDKVQKWQVEVAQAGNTDPEEDKGKGKEEEAPAPVQTHSQQSQLGFRVIKSTKRVSTKPTHIGDITQSTFEPPSFPNSQLATSTPIPASSRHRPAPIPRVEPASPTPASPPFPYSQPSQPLKRPRATTPPAEEVSHKRTRPSQNPSTWRPSSGPGHTTPPSSAQVTPHKSKLVHNAENPPTTPKRPPTLVQLLASQSKRSTTSTPRKTLIIRPTEPVREPSPHYTDHTEPLKDEKEVSELVVGVPSSPISVRSFSQLNESDSDSGSEAAPPPRSSPVPDGPFTQGKEVFEPEYASGVGKGLTAGYGTYSSQFDLEGRINAIQDLLDKDNMFEMFIKEPTEEEGAV